METSLPAVNGSTNTVVVVRVRPFGRKETPTTPCAEAMEDGRSLIARRDERRGGQYLQSQQATETTYKFDATYGPATSQQSVYEQTTKAHVATLAKGQIPALTVVAYGATGAGKTHTMMGDSGRAGVIPRAVGDLFEQLPSSTVAKVSYLEVYNERVFDLLGPDRSKPLKVCEDERLGVVKALELTEAPCSKADEVLSLLSQGNAKRTTEATGANDSSSRSHAVLQVKLGERTLTLVDLAGSERASATGNRGLRLAEGAHINRSLLALANCINALSCPLAPRPKFRDSKLTLILKSALESATVRLVVVACVSPSMLSVDDTMNTLKYAQRAKTMPKKSEAKRRASLGARDLEPRRPARRPSAVGHAPKRRRASVAAMGAPPFRRASSDLRRESLSAVAAARKHAAEVSEKCHAVLNASAPAPAPCVPEAPAPPREKPIRKRRGSIGAPGVAARVKKRRASAAAAAPAPAKPAAWRAQSHELREAMRARRAAAKAAPPEGPPPDAFRPQSQLARTGALPTAPSGPPPDAFRPASQLARTGALPAVVEPAPAPEAAPPAAAAAATAALRAAASDLRAKEQDEHAGDALRAAAAEAAAAPSPVIREAPPSEDFERLEAFRAARKLMRTDKMAADEAPRPAPAPTAVDGEEAGDAFRAFAPVRELARTGAVPQPLRPRPGFAVPPAPVAERAELPPPPAAEDASSPPPVVPPRFVPSPDLSATTSGARHAARAKRAAGSLQERLEAAEARAAAWKDAATDAETVASTLAAALREEWKDRAPAKWAALRDDFATFRARYARHVAAADACLPPQPLGEASNLDRS